MAYDITYPIDFRSGGDSVKVAFSKLIEEVRTIYGILNELAGDDFTDEQRAKILASLTGSIAGSRITGSISGTIDGSQVTGTLTASKVSGELTGATIASGNVTGLEAFVNGKIPADKGDGITEITKSQNGYVKFGNGLILQWGCVDYDVGGTLGMVINFPIEFTKECYSLTVTPQTNHYAVSAFLTPLVWGSSDLGLSISGFRVYLTNLFDGDARGAKLSYMAIGV